jgi:hypothetical protein
MPSLISGRVKVASAGTNYTINNYISLNQAQAGLGFTPTSGTGYTLVIGANGVATFTNTLGNIAFDNGSMTSQSTTGDLTLNPSGTGTITLNGPVNIPDGIIGSGFKREVVVASTANVAVNTVTSTTYVDGRRLTWLDRTLIKDNTNSAENGIYYVNTATFANDTFTTSTDFSYVSSWTGTVINFTDASSTMQQVLTGLSSGTTFSVIDDNALTYNITLASTFTGVSSLLTATTVLGTPPTKFVSAIFVGTKPTNTILRRTTDADTTRELNHVVVPVLYGTSAGRLFFTNYRTFDTLEVSPLSWYEIVDSVSAQQVINKNLDLSPIGAFNPSTGKFTYLEATSLLNISSTIDSTATSNGALTVAGGVGITKNLWVGGATNIAGSFNVLSQANLSPAGATVYVQPSGAGTFIVNPATKGTLDNMDIGNVLPRDGRFVNLSASNQLRSTSTATSTSTTTGALVVDGGVGIAGDLVLGGQLIFSGLADEFVVNNFRAKGQVLFTTSTNSTSTTSGALVVTGGVGIGKDLVLGGNLVFTGDAADIRASRIRISGTATSTSTTTGALTVVGGVGVGENLNVGNDVTIGGNLIFTGESADLRAKQIRVSGTATSTSTTTGALQVVGGVGIGQDLWLGGNLNFANAQGQINAQQVNISGTATSTSTTTGALTVVGGVGIGKDVVIGGNLDLGGQLTFNKSFTATFVALHITSTQSSTAIFEENAVYVEGGVAIKKDLSVYGAAVFTGGLTVLGTQTIVDSTNTYIIDPVIDIGTGIGNAPLSTNDGLDRGLLLHYNTGATSVTDNHAFLGRDNTTGELIWKTNIYPGGGDQFFPATFNSTGTFGTARFGTLRLVGGVASISTNTGDLQVLGGIGVNKNSYFASQVTLASTLANSTQTINHALVVSTGGIGIGGDSYFAGIVRFGNGTATSSPTTGGVLISGGLGISGGAQINGPVKIANGTAATSTTTGALQVVGGVGIQGDLYVRNIYTQNGQTILFDGGTITQPVLETNTTNSISTTTGAIVAYGGAGIGKDLWVGGTGFMGNLFVNGSQVLTTATPTGFNGGTIIYPLQIGYTTSTLNTTGLTVNSDIDAISTDTGAIVTLGGVGIGKNLYVGHTIDRSNDITQPSWGNQGVALNLGSATFTDNTGFGNYTNTQMIYVGQPTFKGPLGVTYNRAQTLYIENAPKAGANTTISDAYAIWVNEGKVHIASSATSATNYLNNALSIDGGLGVKGGVQITGDIKAQGVYDTGNRVVSFVEIVAGSGITSNPAIAGGPTATITISNSGVIQALAGTGINIDQSTGIVTISNVGVTSLTPTQGIGFSTSTGSVTVFNLGVTSLTAGTDTAVSSTTSNIVIWNTSTLETVTRRGATTPNGIHITNTGTSALTVDGTSNFNNVTITGTLSAGSSTFFGSTGTFVDLNVTGNTLLTGSLTVAGTYTYVNSQQLTVVDPVIDVGTGINNVPLLVNDGFDRGLLIHYNSGANINTDAHAFLGRVNTSGKLTYRTNIWPGGVTDVPNPFGSTGTLGGAVFAGLELQGGLASSGVGTGDLQVTGGIYAGGYTWFDGRVRMNDLQNAISTVTGALTVAGGIGVGKNVYVDGDVIVRGYVLTTATAYNGGEVYNPVVITNGTSATSTLTGALIIHDGGAGIGGDLWVGGVVNASDFYVNGRKVTTDIHLVTGPGLSGAVTTATNGVTITMTNTGILNLDAGEGIKIINTGTSGVTTVTNIGVVNLATSGPGLRASTSTGSVTLINLGVTSASAGSGIGVNQTTGSVIITNLGVYSLGTIGDGITATTSTGSVFLINSGVTALTAGTDTAVSAATGAITVWNTSTLQSITVRGNTTDQQIFLDNTTLANNTFSGALQVLGGVGIGKKLYVGGKIVGQDGYEGLDPPAIFVSTSSITVYNAGIDRHIDVVIASNTTTVFNANGITVNTTGTSSVTLAGGALINGIVRVANATTATTTTSAAVVIDGGLAVGANTIMNGHLTPAVDGAYNIGSASKRWGTLFVSSSTIDIGGLTATVVAGTLQLPKAGVYDSTQSTGTAFGALTVKGGAGIGGAIYAVNSINGGSFVSTGTITRSGNVTAGAWGTTGIALSVPAATYTDNSSNGVVALTYVSAFGAPVISSTNSVNYTNAATVTVAGAPTAGGSATVSNAWSLYVANGKVKIADTSVSTNATSGALQVAGGVGIAGDVNIDGYLDVNANTMYVGNSQILTYTSSAITSQTVVNLDTFATGTYQSAKYFIQVVDNTAGGQANRMYVTELIIYHDTIGGVYIQEYGMSSNFGDLGDFEAALNGSDIQLRFTPNYVPTSMIIKVHRTTLSR